MLTKAKPWYLSWPAGVPQTLQYQSVPLFQLLRKTAKENPKKIAIAYRDIDITYSELDSLSDKFASALASMGVRKSDRVAIWLPNIPQFIIAYYGILKVGAVVTAIS